MIFAYSLKYVLQTLYQKYFIIYYVTLGYFCAHRGIWQMENTLWGIMELGLKSS